MQKGKSSSAEDIEPEWLKAFPEIYRCLQDDREFRIYRYQYEPGPSLFTFIGGILEHKQWTIRLSLERKSSMRSVAVYEYNYMNAKGY